MRWTSKNATRSPSRSACPRMSVSVPRIASSVPVVTWPGMIGYGTPDRRPCQRCTSVPHTSDRAVRSSAPPGGRSGSGNSRTSTGACGDGITAASTVLGISVKYSLSDRHENARHGTIAENDDRRRGVTSARRLAIERRSRDRQPARRLPPSAPTRTRSSGWTRDEAQESAQRADAELRAGHDRGPLHGIPISLKDLIDVAGQPTTAASRVLADSIAAGRRADRHAAARGRRRAARQDQPARVRARHDQRGLGVRRGAASARSHALGRRLERRLRRGGGDRHGPRVDRQRHRRVDSDPRVLLRRRRAQARSRRNPDGRRRSAERLARPRRPARAHRPGRSLAVGGAPWGQTRVRPGSDPGRHEACACAA